MMHMLVVGGDTLICVMEAYRFMMCRAKIVIGDYLLNALYSHHMFLCTLTKKTIH